MSARKKAPDEIRCRTIAARLTKSQYTTIHAICKQMDVPISELIRDSLSEVLTEKTNSHA